VIPYGLAALAVVVLGAAACAPDPSDAADANPGCFNRNGPFAPPSFDCSSAEVTCTPIPGYSFPVSDHGGQRFDGNTYRIAARDSFFQPTCALESTPGTVTLRVSNTGGLKHNVKIDEQGIDVDVEVGQTVDVDVEVGADPVVFVCKYHRTSGMVGAVLPGNS
jgi:plastocyanin